MSLKYLLLVSVLLSSASCAKKQTPQPDKGGKTGAVNSSNNMMDDDGMMSMSGAFDQSDKLSDKNYVPDKVYFAFDSSEVNSQGVEAVRRNIKSVNKLGQEVGFDNLKLSVSGHCDERGTAEYNMSLGRRRAVAVEKIFRQEGLNKKVKIIVATYGKSKPLEFGHNESAWQKNRRSEMIVATQMEEGENENK